MPPLNVQLQNSTLRRVIERLHFPLEVMPVCARWKGQLGCYQGLVVSDADRFYSPAIRRPAAHRAAPSAFSLNATLPFFVSASIQSPQLESRS